MALLNRGGTTANMQLNWNADLDLDWQNVAIRDLWKHETIEPEGDTYSVEVIGHEAKVLRVIKQ